MKKYILLVVLLLFLSHQISKAQQDLVGFNTTPFAGVSAVDVQPASILGSVYKVDVTLAGASYFSHNQYLPGNPTLPFAWQRRNFSPNFGGSAGAQILEHTRVHLPSFMVDINNNFAVGFTMQYRSVFQASGISPELGELVHTNLENEVLQNRPLSTALDANHVSWAEFGLVGGYLHYVNDHRIKIAGRIKYINGLNALYMQTDALNYTATGDSTVSITNADFMYGHTQEMDASSLQFQRASVAFDVGVKYSYDNRFVLGASLLDVGRLRFNKANNIGDFSLNQVAIPASDLLEAESVNAFNNNVYALGNSSNTTQSFDVALPAAVSFQATAYLWESGIFEGGGYNNFYLNVITYHRINAIANTDRRLRAQNSYTITPAYTSISIAAGLPFTIDEWNKAHLGGFLRLGPFVMGSRSVFTNLIRGSANDSDAYLLLKIPILKPKPKIVQGCAKRF